MPDALLPAPASKPLLRDADFVQLWASLAINAVGYEISALAIPLAALLLLQATPMQMSVLRMMELLPVLLFVLPGGALVDRMHGKSMLVLRSCAEAAILTIIPLAYLLGHLSIGVMLGAVFALGVVSGLLTGAEARVVNAVLTERRLVDGYSKIQGSAAAAQSLAPGLAGLLVQFFSAPLAILVDALLAAVSALLLWGVRADDAAAPAASAPGGVKAMFSVGFVFIWRAPTLRFLLVQRAAWMLFYQPVAVMLVVYAVDVLKLNAAITGMAFLAGGAGGVLAAALARRIGRERSPAARITLGVGATAVGLLAMLACAAAGLPGAPPLVVFLFIFGFGNTYHTVHYSALRAAATPAAMQGRVYGAMMFCCYLLAPLMLVAAGWLAGVLGVRALLVWLGVYGLCLTLVSLLLLPRAQEGAAA